MKHLGLISISACWLGLIFLIKKWPGDASMTFSQHAAKYKHAAIYYLLLWLIVLPPFYYFMMAWFVPEIGLPFIYKIIITIGSLGLLLAAIFPETVGYKVKLHRLAAFTMAWTLLPSVGWLVFLSQLSLITRVLALVASLYMIYGIVLLLKSGLRHPKMLYAQGSYVLTFHSAILIATYLH